MTKLKTVTKKSQFEIEQERILKTHHLFKNTYEMQGGDCKYDYGGNIINYFYPDIIEKNAIPPRLKNLSLIAVENFQNNPHNDRNEELDIIFKKIGIRVYFRKYVPGDFTHYYIISSKDVNLFQLVLTEDEKFWFSPKIFDLSKYYYSLIEYSKSQN